ncbi:MAG: tRNA (adenosine(37)-N6)-threonylcarbamoyltransferase complex transferase subunit TsaD [Candidatus Aminicenantales bacterium]
MRLLAIETSCDETAAAVLDGDASILSNIVLSQDEIHAPFGGVVPELASRQHLKSIDFIVRESLAAAGVALGQIDHFAVTQGPGLIGSLLVGLSFAKGLAYYHRKPLVGIDHVQAHIEAAFLENKDIAFPVLALIVSGGHTSLFFLKKKLSFKLLGRTRDDAAGEALDKIAKFLDLGYPGGPVIQRIAESGDPGRFEFALPRMTDRSLDFSFSGLKTAAIRIIRENKISKDDRRFPDFLASFENAVVRALLGNMVLAAERTAPKSLLICGGVARNKRLRLEFERRAQAAHLRSYIPSPKLCTDNAAMIGGLALARIAAEKKGRRKPLFSLDLDAYPRMPV